MKTTPIIALDFPSAADVKIFLARFKQESLFVKVGMELYYQTGPDMIKLIKAEGHKVFLDLKLYDIPNTVERAMKGLAQLGADLLNVHAAGGKQMMEAAMQGLIAGTAANKERAKLIAVTQLTSTTEAAMQAEQLVAAPLSTSVINYAKLAQAAGLDGVVCSPLEAQMIRDNTSSEFLRVTPGIRPAGSDVGDQKRIATPQSAKQGGSSLIVVGRPITQAEDPVAAYQMIKEQWEG